jgi:hypothetical protein
MYDEFTSQAPADTDYAGIGVLEATCAARLLYGLIVMSRSRSAHPTPVSRPGRLRQRKGRRTFENTETEARTYRSRTRNS